MRHKLIILIILLLQYLMNKITKFPITITREMIDNIFKNKYKNRIKKIFDKSFILVQF